MNPEAILNCFICNHQFDWNKHQHCPNCNWKIKDFVGDIKNTAVLLRPEREAWVAKKNYKITDFSYEGYVPALLEAMKKQFILEDFNSNYSPSFFKDWDEDSDSFNSRLSAKPIFLGVATWINKLYQPSTGHFPIEITWHSRIEDKNNKYYVIIDKSMAKTTFDATRNPEIYLTLHFDESKGIYAEQAFLIANQQMFEIQPVDSIQLLNIQGDDEASQQNQNAEAQDAEMQTQFKPKIIQPLPKPIVSQQNDSIYSTYCDFMGKLYGRKYTSDDLNAIFTHDDRLLYLFGLSLEDIAKERGLMQIVVQSQVAMDYICKSTELLRIVVKKKLAIKEIESSDLAIQIILNSENAINFIKKDSNFKCLKTSKAIGKIILKIIDFNPESFEHFDDVVNSSEAMNAIANSEIAMKAINASQIAIGKYVAKLANLNPADFKDIDAVANSEVAMKAVASSEIAMKAVANSEIAMKAVANSEIAMKAVANSEIAMKAINATPSALDVLYQHAKKITYRDPNNWKDVLTGKHLLVRVKCVGNDDNASYIKIDNNYYTTSENFNTGTGNIHYSNGLLIDNQLRLVNQSLSASSYCTFEFAYYKL